MAREEIVVARFQSHFYSDCRTFQYVGSLVDTGEDLL